MKRNIEINLDDDDNWEGWRAYVVLVNPESGIDGIYIEGQMEDSYDQEFFEDNNKVPYVVTYGGELES